MKCGYEGCYKLLKIVIAATVQCVVLVLCSVTCRLPWLRSAALFLYLSAQAVVDEQLAGEDLLESPPRPPAPVSPPSNALDDSLCLQLVSYHVLVMLVMCHDEGERVKQSRQQ